MRRGNNDGRKREEIRKQGEERKQEMRGGDKERKLEMRE